MKLAIPLLLMLCLGCATAHKKLTPQTAVLGPPQLLCNGPDNQHVSCEWVQPWEAPGRKPGTTAQLSPIGCALHTLVTGGHIPLECRNEKAKRGRWIWHKNSK